MQGTFTYRILTYTMQGTLTYKIHDFATCNTCPTHNILLMFSFLWTGELTHTQIRYLPLLYVLVILFQSMTYILNVIAVLVRFKLQYYVNIFFY